MRRVEEKQFVVHSDEERCAAWDRLYEILEFHPNHDPAAKVCPFVFLQNTPHRRYDIAWVYGEKKPGNREAYEKTMLGIARRLCREDEYLLALDWHHSTFTMWPHRAPPTEEFEEVPYENAPVGELGWMSYRAYYPSFYPDGDYYFFLAADCSWGFLGHPWRQEEWVFGEKALLEYERAFGEHKKQGEDWL